MNVFNHKPFVLKPRFSLKNVAPCCLLILLLILFSYPASAEATFPQMAFVKNLNSDSSEMPEFLQLECEPDKASNRLFCYKTYTRITKKTDGGETSYEDAKKIVLSEFKENENYLRDIDEICNEFKKYEQFLDGDKLGGQFFSDEEKATIHSQWKRSGLPRAFLSDLVDLCGKPSLENLVKIVHTMMLAEDKQCIVDTFSVRDQGAPFVYDQISGTASRSSVENGLCYNYLFTEIMHLNRYGLPAKFQTKIELLERHEHSKGFLVCEENRVSTWIEELVYYQPVCSAFIKQR